MGSGDNFSKLATLVFVFLFATAVYITKPFFSVILFSFFIAYLLVPLYSFLKNRIKHKRMAAAASVLLALTVFVLIGIRIIYVIVTEISTLLNSPENVQLLIETITNRTVKMIEINVPLNSPQIAGQISQFISGLTDTYFPPKKTVVIFLTATLPFYIVALIIGFIFSYYLLLNGNQLIDQILTLVPNKNQEEVKLFLKELDSIYSGLFRQHFVSSVIVGIIALLGFYLLDVPFPGVLALLVFILSMYPIIGLPGVYLPLAAYYALLQEYSKALEIILFSIVLSALQDYYLRPKLVEQKGAVHPVITILAFGAPLLIIGVTGLVIGPAVYGFLLAYYRIKLRLKEGK